MIAGGRRAAAGHRGALADALQEGDSELYDAGVRPLHGERQPGGRPFDAVVDVQQVPDSEYPRAFEAHYAFDAAAPIQLHLAQ